MVLCFPGCHYLQTYHGSTWSGKGILTSASGFKGTYNIHPRENVGVLYVQGWMRII